jgi:hypothetical protein
MSVRISALQTESNQSNVSMHSLSITETDTAGIVEHRGTAALESRLADFRHGEEVGIEGAEELTAARQSSSATKKLTHEGSSTAVVSLAVLSTASSPHASGAAAASFAGWARAWRNEEGSCVVLFSVRGGMSV